MFNMSWDTNDVISHVFGTYIYLDITSVFYGHFVYTGRKLRYNPGYLINRILKCYQINTAENSLNIVYKVLIYTLCRYCLLLL